MNPKKGLTLLATAAALTPSTVPAALADGCSPKLIKTSYQRISPRTVKETKIYEKTRLISKAALKHSTHRSTFVRKTAHLAPRTFKTVTTTRTSMFIPTASVMTSPMIVRPVVVSPTATTTVRASGLVPSTTIFRASEIAPTTVVRTTAVRPACTVIKTQSSVLVPKPIVSAPGVVAGPGETVVFKEKHGKLKQIGTLQPIVVY